MLRTSPTRSASIKHGYILLFLITRRLLVPLRMMPWSPTILRCVFEDINAPIFILLFSVSPIYPNVQSLPRRLPSLCLYPLLRRMLVPARHPPRLLRAPSTPRLLKTLSPLRFLRTPSTPRLRTTPSPPMTPPTPTISSLPLTLRPRCVYFQRTKFDP
jgi:hypothetical protein